MTLVVICILTLLAWTALVIVRQRSLFAAAMLAGIYSFLGASWMMLLDAPDVAFTEAAVGAGISTVLMLGTLALTSREERQSQSHPWALLLVVLTGAALVWATLDMPHFGDPAAPAQNHVAPRYLSETPEAFQIPNVVTAVLGSYRGYDTLGETTVIFTAGVAVLLLLGGRRRKDEKEERS